ncbi:MAG: polysaccharide deacetylase [Oscillochloridaceae bacterium umkhey_bin13]
MTAVIPFQIMVGGHGTSGYALRAAGVGRTAEATLVLPPLSSDPEALGRDLGQALFPNPVRQLLIDVARGADESGARVQLQLYVSPPELAVLPWEWATLGGETLWRPAVRDDYALVRISHSMPPHPPLELAGPLRLLVACAPGMAAAANALAPTLAGPVRDGTMVVDLLRDADLAALRVALAEEPCHALHLVAADASGQGSSARLRLGRGLDAAGLIGLLEDYPDLRLLTLAADAGPDPAALASIAGAIHEQLGLATVALGGLDATQTAAFCGPCYTALASYESADLAVTDGRVALEATGGLWGAPRFWTAPGTGPLFSAATTPRRAPTNPADATPVGTVLRPSAAASALGRTASRALATARSFVVDATAVGEPAQRQRPAPTRPNWLQPRLVVLLVAALVLMIMVSQVLPSSDAAPTAPVAPTPALILPTIGPLDP